MTYTQIWVVTADSEDGPFLVSAHHDREAARAAAEAAAADTDDHPGAWAWSEGSALLADCVLEHRDGAAVFCVDNTTLQ